MNVWIALLRGINVGGKNRLPMATLSRLFNECACENVQTIIQSGNVVFSHAQSNKDRIARSLMSTLDEHLDFVVQALILSKAEFFAAVQGNPFPCAEEQPNSLHLYFLAEKPNIKTLHAIELLRASDERYALHNKTLYLSAPSGVGRSKLASRLEKLLGVPATARNWRTVTRIATIAKALDEPQ